MADTTTPDRGPGVFIESGSVLLRKIESLSFLQAVALEKVNNQGEMENLSAYSELILSRAGDGFYCLIGFHAPRQNSVGLGVQPVCFSLLKTTWMNEVSR